MIKSLVSLFLIQSLVSPAPAAAATDAARSAIEPSAARADSEPLGLDEKSTRSLIAAESAKDSDLRALREKRRAALSRLRSQLAEDAPDAQIEASLARIAALQQSIEDRNRRFETEIRGFLRPKQRARFFFESSASAKADPAENPRLGDLYQSAGEDAEPE